MNIGHFYFITQEYFEHFSDNNLMSNHLKNDHGEHNRPYLLAFSEKEGVAWAIPISSKIRKFSDMYTHKVAQNKRCDTIDFVSVLGHKKAILIQNMTPVSEKYLLKEYVDSNANPVKLAYKENKRIIHKAKKVLALQRKGYDLIWGKALEIESELTK